MSEFIMPEFLKKDYSKIEVPEVCRLVEEYEEKFDDEICTEGLIMDEEELIAALKICLKESKTFEEVTGIGDVDDDDDI